MKDGFTRLQKTMTLVQGRNVVLIGVKVNGTPSTARFLTNTDNVVSLSDEEMQSLPPRFKKEISL